MPFTFRHPLYLKQRWPPANALPSLLTSFTMMSVFCVCPHIANCQIFAPAVPRVATICRMVKEREERKEDGHTVEMALHQINVITALIRQPFNLKGARTERARQAEGKRGRQQGRRGIKKTRASVAFKCPPTPTPLTPSPPPSFHWL